MDGDQTPRCLLLRILLRKHLRRNRIIPIHRLRLVEWGRTEGSQAISYARLQVRTPLSYALIITDRSIRDGKGFLFRCQQKAEEAGGELQYHWGVLALGEPFERSDTSDFLKPCPFHLVESMLSVWLGALKRARVFADIQGVNDILLDVPWQGVNHKFSIREGWSNHISIKSLKRKRDESGIDEV